MKLLVEIDGNRIVRQVRLTKSRYSLGRDSGNDVVFSSSKVSKRHAEIIEEGDTYALCDMGSRNHVYVEGQRVHRKRLRSGDTINISRSVTLLFISERDSQDAVHVMVDRLWETVKKKDFMRLKEVTNRIISLESLDNILNVILSEAIRLVSADRGFIALADEEGQLNPLAFVHHNLSVDQEKGFEAVVSNTAVQRAIGERTNVFIPNTCESEETLTQSARDLQRGSILCSPLQFGEELVGVLYVDSGFRLTDFNEMDQFCFSMLADHAAIAIQNAGMYDQLKGLNQQLEREFQESEDRYTNLVQVFPEAIFVHRNGTIVFANPAAAKLLRVDSAEQLVGKPSKDLFSSDFHEEINKHLREQTKKKKRWRTLETNLVCFDRESVEVEVILMSLVIQGMPGVLLIARDITHRRKMEEELQKAQKLESISTLAGGLAHDFNNILTAILGHISLAQFKLADGEYDDIEGILNQSEKACLRAEKLTHQLLTFARGGAPVIRVASVESLLKESVPFIVRGSNIRCEFSLSDKLRTVKVDEGQVEQVINNIVLNAVQSMPKGGVLEVKAENVTLDKNAPMSVSPGDYVKISFRDHGRGIPEKILPNIFDPFFTTKQYGSGLGLATTYSIIKRHGGAITVESVVGRGSTFQVYLPVSSEFVVQRPAPEKVHAVGSGRVLIMDDEKEIRNVAGEIIKELGFKVDYARDGSEAIELYRRFMAAGKTFDAVIMDLTIPDGMGGAEAIKNIIRIDPDVKAIVSSGYSNNSIMSDFSSYGFKGVLKKPYNVQKLSAILGEVLGKDIR